MKKKSRLFFDSKGALTMEEKMKDLRDQMTAQGFSAYIISRILRMCLIIFLFHDTKHIIFFKSFTR